jgi:succinate dehydrogenase cytochrome b556 subunit
MTKISPHVSIYKFPITAITSILNRGTGVALSGMFVLSGTCLAFGKNPLDHYSKLHPWQKTFVNYGILLPTIYHAFGGIRHMVWDKYPKLLHNSAVHRSSILLISSSLITTILSEKFVINKNLENVFRPRNYKEIDVSGLIEEEIINIPDICN